MPSLEFTVLAVVFLMLLYYLFLKSLRKYPQGILLIFFLYVIVSVNTSVFYLDYNSVYISEASIISDKTNASFRLVFFNFLIIIGIWLGFYSSRIFFGKLDTVINPPSLYQCYLALFVVAFVLLISIFNIIVTGNVPYPGSGFSRHAFWENGTRFNFIPNIFGILIFFIPFVCVAIWIYSVPLESKRIAFLSKVTIFFYFLYLLIGGQVFHGFLLPITVIFGVLMADKMHNGVKIFNYKRALFFLIISYIVINVVYSSFENRGITKSFDSVAEAIVYRVLALQGSTYWASDAIWYINGPIGTFYSLLEGRDFLIESIMPAKLAESYLEAGINLQGALPAATILSVGFFYSIFICFIYGLCLGFFISLVFYAIFKGKIFLLFPLGYIWLWTIGVYSRGSLEEIFSLKFLVFIMITIVYFFLFKSKPVKIIKYNHLRNEIKLR